MKTELRSMVAQLRAAQSDKKFVITGLAAAFNKPADIGGKFKEVIKPGAFARSLAGKNDIKCLLGHDVNKVLGRRQNGTLALRETSDGLEFDCQLDSNNPEHVATHAMITRGDISECSFGFTVDESGEDWAEQNMDGARCIVRTLRAVNLLEISAVAWPAYNGTQVQARTSKNEADWRSIARARLAELDAQYDAHLRRVAERIGREIAGGK